MDDNRAQTPPVPARKKRKFRRRLALFAFLTFGLVLALPWLLGTPPGRGLIAWRVNARLAPSSVTLDGLGLSWTNPIELTGVALRDSKGKIMLGARRVALDRGILGLLASRPDYGTISIEWATVDVERRANGTIDLFEALDSASRPDPQPGGVAAAPTPSGSATKATIVIKGGTLKIASPELVEPIAASSLDATVTIAPGKPIDLSTTLGGDGRSLEIRSTIDQDSTGDRSLVAISRGWPIHVRAGGVEARGRIEGTVNGRQGNGLWKLKGDAAIVGVEASGPALRGDTPALDKVSLIFDAEQSSKAWAFRQLELNSPVASLRGEGSVPAIDGTSAQLRGRVDLAALVKLLPKALKVRDGVTFDRGTVNIKASLVSSMGADRLELAASVDDFAAHEVDRPVLLHGPVLLTARGSQAEGKVAVESLEVKAAGVDVTAGGDFASGVKLAGTVDLVALMAQLRDLVDLGAYDLSGHARLAADYRHTGDTFKGRFAFECKDLKIVGLAAEPIVREKVRLDASTFGKVADDGMPTHWQQAQVDLKAGDLKFDLVATSKDAGAWIVSGVGFDVASPAPGRLEARATFQRKGPVIEVEELRGGLSPTDPNAPSGTVGLAIRGRADLSTGEAAFEPIPGSGANAIGLGQDGAKVSGLGRGDAPLRVVADLLGDLAAIDRLLAAWSGSPTKGLGGVWTSQLAVTRSVAGKLDVDAKVNVPNIVAPGLKGPVTLVARGGYAPELDRLDLSNLDVLTEYGRVRLAAKLLETKGRRMVDLTGTFDPNWAILDPLITASVEPTARFRATARPIRLAGSLKADSTLELLGQLQGEFGLDLTEAQAFGMTLAPTPVVLNVGGGLAKFDPIRTTMNGGPVSILGSLALDDADGVWLRLDPSRVDNAAINEAVSNAILAYAAPVLAKSSGVSGKVTVAVNRAMVPITAQGTLSMDGMMILRNTVFKPGPLGAELTSITGQPTRDLKLDQSLVVQVRDGRVKQTGLAIPIGGDGFRVLIDGSVGFDDSLDLVASVPLTARALGLDKKLDQAIAGTKVTLPIRGTLSRPAVDQRALRVALRDATKGLGEKQLKSEAGRLIDRLAGPKPATTEPRSKSARANPLGELEDLGREILDPKKP